MRRIRIGGATIGVVLGLCLLTACSWMSGGSGLGAATPSASAEAVDPNLLRVVADDTGAVSARVPAAWQEVQDAGFTDDAGIVWRAVAAAPSLDAFWAESSAPGAQIMAARGVGQSAETTFLALAPSFDDCSVVAEPGAYVDAVHRGIYAVWDCNGTSAVLVSALLRNGDSIVAIIQAATEAERTTGLSAILESFRAQL